jgi:hypothetical protein
MTTPEGTDEFRLTHAWPVLERMTDDDVHAICHDLSVSGVNDLASVVGVPRVVLARDSSAGRVLRNRLRRNAQRAKLAVEVLVRPTRDLAVAELGERSAEPSYEDLVEALPTLLERHGTRRVALLLSYAVDDRWAAAEPSQRILDTDDRFAADALGPVIDDTPPPKPTRPVSEKSAARPERAPKTKQPKRGKGPRGERPTYKKKRPSDAPQERDRTENEATSDAPAITVDGRTISPGTHHRRDVRILGSYRDVDRDDPIVGRVVLAEVEFEGPIEGAKVRPCVVVAACGAHDLIVRPCYSEGGRRAGDFRAVQISDPDAAGLDRTSFVSHEERCIARTSVTGELGWLPTADWNQL